MESFHSRFNIDELPDDQRQAFRTALRLGAEKRGQVWITEGGETVAALILAGRLAEIAIDQVRGD